MLLLPMYVYVCVVGFYSYTSRQVLDFALEDGAEPTEVTFLRWAAALLC